MNSTRPRSGRKAVQTILPPLLAIAVIFAVWQSVAMAGIVQAGVLPAPSVIAEQGWAQRDALLRHTLPTLTAMLIGFSLSLSVAFVAAIALDFFLPLRRAVVPLLIISQTLPLIVLAPLVVLWFGFGLLPKVLLVAFVTFFPMAVGLMRGFASADPDAEHLLRSMGARRVQVFRMIRLPQAMPSFFSALRISITYAVVAAIFAEYAGAVAGLGVYMQTAKNIFRTDLVLAAVAVGSALTLLLYALVAAVELVALPWLSVERGSKR